MKVFELGRQFARLRSLQMLLVGLGIGYLAGLGASPSAAIRADVTEEPRREAFKAGGVLNEPVLREIAATLVRIETRVEKIERSVAPVPAGAPAGPGRKK
jgi:hypothetical protein